MPARFATKNDGVRKGTKNNGMRKGTPSLLIDQADPLNGSHSDQLLLAAFCRIDPNKDPFTVRIKNPYWTRVLYCRTS